MRPTWEIDFNYLETCNCPPCCPCPFTGMPTLGYCHLVMAFNVLDGRYQATAVADRNAVIVADVPGSMRAPGYRTAIYLDARCSAGERESLETIFTGKGGGVFEGFAALTTEWLGVRDRPIAIEAARGTVTIPGILELSFEPIRGFGGKTAQLMNTWQRVALGAKINVGQAIVSRFDDYGLNWDSAGGNVFWGRYRHSDLSGTVGRPPRGIA